MSSYFWFFLLLTVTTATSECPQDCICTPIQNQQTPQQYHAKCTSLNYVKENMSYPGLHSLDISLDNLEAIPIEIHALKNLSHLDLSRNHLTKLTKLNNRIISLDLSHNRLTSSEIVNISPKIRILNLSFNEITHLPLDVINFKSLKSINLIGNRIDCSCETLTIRDWLHRNNVQMNKHTICASPLELRHQPWNKISIKEICSIDERMENENKIQFGYQSSRELQISDFVAEEFLPFVSHNILKRQVPNETINDDEGSGIEPDVVPTALNNDEVADIDPDVVPSGDEIENGSGEGSGAGTYFEDVNSGENVSPEENDYEEEPENDGSGSGGGPILFNIPSENNEENHSTQEPDIIDPTEVEESKFKTMKLNIFEGARVAEPVTTAAPDVPVDTGVIQQNEPDIEKKAAINVAPEASAGPISKPDDLSILDEDSNKHDESSSTYILLAVVGILLVSLIVYVVFRRRRNRRRSSYSSNDAENVREIEMLDIKKNSNGKQQNVEIIPLMPKKEQPNIEKGMGDQNREINSNIQPLHTPTYPKVDEKPTIQIDVPQTTAPLPENNNNLTETQPESSPEIPKTADERDDKRDKPLQNGHNGHTSDDEVFLPEEVTVKRYSPVYSPETGRVKIKLMETPKPKTPMLVTRSRSNAGAYITTPNLNIRSASANGQ